MKTPMLMAALLMTPVAQAYVTTAWTSDPGGTAIAVDVSDAVYTANADINPGGEIQLTKRDSAGNILWVASAPNIDVGYEVANWVSVDHAGNIIVTGTLQGGSFANRTNRAGLIMKFDPDGQLLWSQTFDGIDNGSYTRKHVVDADDNIHVIGVGSGVIAKVRSFASDGSFRWSYGALGTLTTPYQLSLTPEGHLLVMTSASAVAGFIVYAKLDGNGQELWRKTLNSRSSGYAADDALGNTYLVHMEYGVTDEGTVLKKLSPTGTVLWERVRKGLISPFVAVSTDNAPVISGLRPGVGAAFIQFDADGFASWENLDADGPSMSLQPWSPTQRDDLDNYYVQGNGGLCKVNHDGSSGWSIVSSNSAGFAVGSDQSVYTVGATTAKLIEIPGTTPSSDLGLGLTVTPSTVTLGQTIQYSARVTNSGPSVATGVTVTGSVASMTSCQIASLAPGATASCTLTETPATTGTFSRVVTARGIETDPNFSNNRQETFISVLPAAATADLALTMTEAPDPVRRGSQLVYTLKVRNNGPSHAGSVSLRDWLPADATFVSAIPTRGTCSGLAPVTCALGTLNSGASASVKITIRPRLRGDITNTASVNSGLVTDPNPANNNATVTTTVTR
ncbi:CARDB domain-containing protein [Thiocystis violacea]|uniref:CARDB domain-containing protein n=1 Tax=Thiocystis violacea TaxID=13725 RepID=UPI001905E76E|nr:CARDB domain-containing protein [Thiocystis violacea]